MIKWVAEVCRKYLFQLKMKSLLVRDNAIIHQTSKGKDKLKEYKTASSVIPSGLTWILQPLVISINKKFKELRCKYVGHWIGKNNIKVSKRVIIAWIDESWY